MPYRGCWTGRLTGLGPLLRVPMCGLLQHMCTLCIPKVRPVIGYPLLNACNFVGGRCWELRAERALKQSCRTENLNSADIVSRKGVT